MIKFPFVLDDYQKKAIEAIENDSSVLISAPTGSGKTVIADYIIDRSLDYNQGVIYTAPIKALSNQKFRDFRAKYSDKVGILTGDVSFNADAPIVVMTTEIFRNRLVEQNSAFQKYSWVIFDEIHYIDDLDRGTVWEESLIFMPKHMRIAGLSATIPNIKEFSSWIEKVLCIKVKVIKESKRAVPLTFYVQAQGKIFNDLRVLHKKVYRKRRRLTGLTYKKALGLNNSINSVEKLIDRLYRSERLPAIYFSFGRKRCEILAQEIVNAQLWEEDLALYEEYKSLLEMSDLKDNLRAKEMGNLLKRGVAYHHAGMHPELKDIVEQLFSKRMIKLIFTTETFALGVNMPARSVIIDELFKKIKRKTKKLSSRDFLQMAGRAGRRGIDTKGYVYCRFNPYITPFEDLQSLLSLKSEAIFSKFNIAYSALLTLYSIHKDRVIDIYNQSFHFFQQRKKKKSQAKQMERRLRLLKKLKYIDRKNLTKEGIFASKIYGYELMLTELHKRINLDSYSYIELSLLLLALVVEEKSFFKRFDDFLSDKKVRRLNFILGEIYEDIRDLEKKYKVKPPVTKFSFALSKELLLWMDGADFQSVAEGSLFDDGEIIRYFRMLLQLMRELSTNDLSEECKKKLSKAYRLIDRDVVSAEKQILAYIENEAQKNN